MSHKLNIILTHTEPKIYRKVIVPERFTFHQLHTVIQIVMGWDDYHLYQFNLGAPYNSDTIMLPNEDTEDFSGYGGRRHSNFDSRDSMIGEVFNNSQKQINYIYDFGDDWLHSIKPMAKPKEEVLFPICIDGQGSPPVEDCGGLGGFYEMLETLNSPKNTAQKKEMQEWLGLKKSDTYDKAFGFDQDEINDVLKTIFSETQHS